MPFGPAIASILALFLCWWALNTARDPKRWRLWWMNLFGIADVNSTRAQRREQERQLSVLAYVLSILCLLAGLSCIYWTSVGIREALRPKTQFEIDLERTRRQAEEIKARRPF